MIDANVQIDGAEAVLRVLRSIPGAIDSGVEMSAATLRKLAVGGTPYRTGRLKRMWGRVERRRGGFSFTNPLSYARILEEGLYTQVGPRTIATSAGIFSRQAPEGILSPLVSDDATLRRVAELIVKELVRGIESAGA